MLEAEVVAPAAAEATPSAQPNEMEQMRQIAAAKLSFSDHPAPAEAEKPAETAAPAAVEGDEEELDERGKNLKALRERLSGGAAPAAEEEEEEIPAAVLEYAKKKGWDMADISQVGVYKTTAAEKEAEAAKATKQLERFASLPTALKNAIDAADKKDPDWAKHITNVAHGIDFGKKFEKQDKAAMLRAYAGGRMTEAEIVAYANEEADDVTVAKGDAYMELSRTKFDAEADRVENHLQRQQEEENKYRADLKASRDASVNKLVARVKEAAPFKKDIAKALTPEGVLGIYFDPKTNLLRPEAADLITHALFYKELVAPAREREAAAVKDKAILAVVRRTGELPPDGKGGNRTAAETPAQQAQKLAKEKLSFG